MKECYLTTLCIFLQQIRICEPKYLTELEKCGRGRHCVSFSRCRVACDLARSGILQRNTTARDAFYENFCGVDEVFSTIEKVCCDDWAIADYTYCDMTESFEDPSFKSLQKVDCGLVPEMNQRIIGGQDAFPGQFAWTVYINMSDKSCGGALISDRHIVTAAHCITSPDRMRAWLGETDLARIYDCYDPDCEEPDTVECYEKDACAPPAREYEIDKVWVHPEYLRCGEKCNKYDVAVLTTKKTVIMSEYVSPVCLPAPYRTLLDTSKLSTAGWGLTEGNNLQNPARTNHLHFLDNVRILDPKRCGSKFPGDVKLCAGQEMKEAPCSGDSGSPLTNKIMDGNRARYELVGVVNSAGSWECGGRAEIGYARIGVPSILNWIYSIVFPD